jgi:hypothetical protein
MQGGKEGVVLVVLEINCIVPLQTKFLELSGTEKKALH